MLSIEDARRLKEAEPVRNLETGTVTFPPGYFTRKPWNAGKHWAEETKAKISSTLKGHAPPNKGKRGEIHLSEETKVRMGLAHKGSHLSEATKLKISLALKGRPLSTEAIRKAAETHREKPMLEETKQKLSSSLKGQVPWNQGKHLSAEHKSKVSLALKGKPHTAEHTKAALKGLAQRPTIPEQKMEAILNYCCPNQYNYSGDGLEIIKGMVPDFISTNGNKKVIEVFGDYWHSPEITGVSYGQAERERIEKFRQAGFECLVIWEHELDAIVWDKEIAVKNLSPLINKILEFSKNGGPF